MKLTNIKYIIIDGTKYHSMQSGELFNFLRGFYPEYAEEIKHKLVKDSYKDIIQFLITKGHKLETN